MKHANVQPNKPFGALAFSSVQGLASLCVAVPVRRINPSMPMKNKILSVLLSGAAALAIAATGCASSPASATAVPAQVKPTISHQVLDSTSADGFWGKIGIPMGSIGALGFQFGVGRLNNTAAINPVSNQTSHAPALAVLVGGRGAQSLTGTGGQSNTNAAAGMADKGADFSIVSMGEATTGLSKDGTNGYSATVTAAK